MSARSHVHGALSAAERLAQDRLLAVRRVECAHLGRPVAGREADERRAHRAADAGTLGRELKGKELRAARGSSFLHLEWFGFSEPFCF